MNEPISVRGANLPRIVADVSELNQYLKTFSIAALALLFVMSLFCASLLRRPPVVLAFSENAVALNPTHLPSPEDEIREAIRTYVSYRYCWTPQTVGAQLTKSESFISRASITPFRAATGNIGRFAIDKHVEQRVYPGLIEVDLSSQSARIAGDRITVMQSLRAATPLQLTLKFESGPRTQENPWGLYITQEKDGTP